MEYEFRTHRCTEADPETRKIIAEYYAMALAGFHGASPTEAFLAQRVKQCVENRELLRSVHQRKALPAGYSKDYPVATFSEWQGSINLGRELVEVLQISMITVSAAHRRQGLMRKLMTQSLSDAHDAGIPVAALTASEATIYSRFGFAPATYEQRVEVDVSATGELLVPTTGRVDYLDQKTLPRSPTVSPPDTTLTNQAPSGAA